MRNEAAPVVVPVRFAGVDVLVQATEVRVVGSEPTSAVDRLVDVYQKAESAIVGVAESVAATIEKLKTHAQHPSAVEVEFGLSVSTAGTVVVVSGTLEANLSVKLIYGSEKSGG
jgi:hypothetical protein